MAEQVALADPDTVDAIDPGQDPGVFERADRLADGRRRAAGLVGDRRIGRVALARLAEPATATRLERRRISR